MTVFEYMKQNISSNMSTCWNRKPCKPTTGKNTKHLTKDTSSELLKKAEKQVVPTNNICNFG